MIHHSQRWRNWYVTHVLPHALWSKFWEDCLFSFPFTMCANFFFRLINRNTSNHLHWLFSSTFSELLLTSVSLFFWTRSAFKLPSPTCVPSCTQGRLVSLQIRQHVLCRVHQRASHLQGEMVRLPAGCVWWLYALSSHAQFHQSTDLIWKLDWHCTMLEGFSIVKFETLVVKNKQSYQIYLFLMSQ